MYLDNVVQMLHVGDLGVDQLLGSLGALVVRVQQLEEFAHGEGSESRAPMQAQDQARREARNATRGKGELERARRARGRVVAELVVTM